MINVSVCTGYYSGVLSISRVELRRSAGGATVWNVGVSMLP